MRKYCLSLCFIFLFIGTYAQVPDNYRFVKTFVVDSRFARIDSIDVDTMHLNYQASNPIDRFGFSNCFNGNLGSPIQSKLYFSRPIQTDFIFSTPYYPYLMDLNHSTFYNTKTPFSYLNYFTGGSSFRAQDDFKFLFTANASKKLNIGTTLNYLHSIGEYQNQATDRFAGSLFGSYEGKHYSAKAVVSTNSLKNQENGGLLHPEDILTDLETKVIPTRLAAQSNFKQNQLFYNHQYSIGFERPVKINKDSVRMDYIPVTRFGHTFRFDQYSKRYYEPMVNKEFYTNSYGTSNITKDSTNMTIFTNNLSVSLAEEFNTLMKFGLTAFVENEIQSFTRQKNETLGHETLSNTRIGGILSKQQGRRFRYDITGDFCFLGYKIGDISIDGKIGGFFRLWKDSVSLIAKGFLKSEEPSPYLNFYESKHFRWQNDFNKVFRTRVGGLFALPNQKLSLDLNVENITRNIYFDKDALPRQYEGNIQVISADFRKDFRFGKFWLENHAVYQVSSTPQVLPLPTLSLYHNFYYLDKWFHVLSIQAGTSVRYHTLYYAPVYMPATGQFYVQQTEKVGNYPLLSAYLNCHLKRTRFFAEYYHLNKSFSNGQYYSMPGYPLSPTILKLGISWNFYD